MLSFMNIPHPPIIISQIRINDIWLLLFVGAIYELLCRCYILFFIKCKSNILLLKEYKLQQLQKNVIQLRKLGPSKFVETSKVERQILNIEKELETIYIQRKRTCDVVEKQLLRYGNIQVAVLIFFLYYGVPILSIQTTTNDDGVIIPSNDDDDDTNSVAAGIYLKRILFPISYIGTGIKLSRFGIIPPAQAACSFGALAIMWSAQVTMGQFMDAVDAYFLQ